MNALIFLILAICCIGGAYGIALVTGMATTGNRGFDMLIGGANLAIWSIVFIQYI